MSAPEEDKSINVSVTFRHTDSSPALRDYAEEKIVNCLQKYISREADVHVVLSVEKRDHKAEVNITSKGFDLMASGVTEDLYSAIDKMVDVLDTQARKRKEKVTDHKNVTSPKEMTIEGEGV